MTEAEKQQKIITSIKRAKTIAIFCHLSPDGDTIGSGLALYHALVLLKKSVRIFCPDEVPEKLKSLPGSDKIESAVSKDKFDLSVAVDVAALDRLATFSRMFFQSKDSVTIDHHKSNTNFSKFTFYKSCSATAEMIYEILKEMKLLNADIAMCLYTGIVTDSGCFSFSSVTPETHIIAAELLSYDFDAGRTIYETYRAQTRDIFVLKNRILSRAEFSEGGKVGLILTNMTDLAELGLSISDTEGFITGIINVIGVEVAFALTEIAKNQYKISVRTKDYVDASDLAAVFGGGGHVRAAGCRLSGNIHDIKDKLLKAAKDRL